MRKAILSLTDLTASKRTMLALLAASLVGMVVLFGVGIRTAETQTTPTTSTTTYYKAEDLGTLGGSRSYASAINDAGQVVGYSYTAGDQNYHAFLYDRTKGMTDLGTLGGSYSSASGINKSGQVVGMAQTSNWNEAYGVYETHAFLYDSKNGMKDLNDLVPADSGWSIGEAKDINTDGKIAATGWPTSLRDRCNPSAEDWADFDTALVLTPGTTATYEVQGLDTLGGDYSYATGINDSGQVVGRSMLSNCYEEHAFLYDENATPTKMQDLGGAYSEAKGINTSGKVVGHTENWDLYDQCTNFDCWRAFLYDASATPKMQELGTLGTGATYGTFGSEAKGINDSGKVVGKSGIGDGQHHWVTGSEPAYGFIYDSTNGMKDLNNLIPPDSGWTIDEATAISTDGKIAANGHKAGVGWHALLLTPTSEIPTPEITSPQNNTYDTDGSFSVSGSAAAGSTMELFEGSTSKGTTKADSSTGAWSIALSGVSEGTHTYSAKAKDAAGYISPASNTVTVTVDKTAPKVSSVSPTSGATKVALNTSVAAMFSESIDPKTLISNPTDPANANVGTSTTFTLVKSGTTTPISAKVSYDDTTKKVTLTPSSKLAARSKYTAKISTGVKDLAGNALGAAYTWSFTTGSQ